MMASSDRQQSLPEAVVAEFRGDQAAGLRRLFGREQPRIVTFAAGSIGVGKSIAVANLAASLARQGKEVLVLDENTRDNIAAYYGFRLARTICSR